MNIEQWKAYGQGHDKEREIKGKPKNNITKGTRTGQRTRKGNGRRQIKDDDKEYVQEHGLDEKRKR